MVQFNVKPDPIVALKISSSELQKQIEEAKSKIAASKARSSVLIDQISDSQSSLSAAKLEHNTLSKAYKAKCKEIIPVSDELSVQQQNIEKAQPFLNEIIEKVKAEKSKVAQIVAK